MFVPSFAPLFLPLFASYFSIFLVIQTLTIPFSRPTPPGPRRLTFSVVDEDDEYQNEDSGDKVENDEDGDIQDDSDDDEGNFEKDNGCETVRMKTMKMKR